MTRVSSAGRVWAARCSRQVRTESGRPQGMTATGGSGPDRAGGYQMGATLSAGMALRWLREQLYDDPSMVSYDTMMALAAKETPGAGGLLFLPYLVGERTPGEAARKASAQTGPPWFVQGAAAPSERANPYLEIEDYDPEADLMVLNLGPQHPSTHGVFRVKLYLDGELIVKAVP